MNGKEEKRRKEKEWGWRVEKWERRKGRKETFLDHLLMCQIFSHKFSNLISSSQRYL